MTCKELKFEVLNELRDILVRDLQPDRHFAFLRSKRVLDEDDCEEINANTTRRKKAEQFLDILSMKGESAFDFFCESFIKNGKTQLHLLNQILDAYEEKTNESEECQPSRPIQDYINMETLNDRLPRPGDAGAPCLPSYRNPYMQTFHTNGPTLMVEGVVPMDDPPPYST